MIIVGIETSAKTGSVALWNNEQVVEERFFTKGLRHGKELIPALDSIVRSHDLQPENIDLFAVSQGPGSYTGIRVGVTCAKTLAWSLGKDMVGVPSMDVIARNAPESARRVCTILDAKRKRVYFCDYHRQNGKLVRQTDDLALTLDAALERLGPGAYVTGDAINLYHKEFSERGADLAEEERWLPRASSVAVLAAEKYRTAGPDDPFTIVPIYLHRPEAEEVWERRQKQKQQNKQEQA